ncbi:MAG TPA: serine protease [Gammaproteobacteria bacterium]|nr:serine protease [Gammaproteobacteria bacterium]
MQEKRDTVRIAAGPEPADVIPRLRESVVAILRLHPNARSHAKKDGGTFEGSIVGTAFCVLANRYLLTAHHILAGGAKRLERDRFVAFAVPRNGRDAVHFPVTGFPLERPDLDFAVLAIEPGATAGFALPALALGFEEERDGAAVLSLGFPAPKVVKLGVDPAGNYRGGEFFLKSHANTGIVSAFYTVGGIPFYELNIGWHHGESGGPIVTLSDPPVAFSMMQHYRNIQSPHGVMAGPHRGRSFAPIRDELAALGVHPA